jgi:nucleotide-binding universal stress UspA family protein
MIPVHRILYPTDFSEHSGYAFALACALAEAQGADLVVLHVVPPIDTHGEVLAQPWPGGFYEDLRDRLKQLQAPEGSGISVDHWLEEGDPASEIVRVAATVGADLIVLGTHGRTGVHRLLMGSVAEQVVRRAACPVLTVKLPFPAGAARAEGQAVGQADSR